MGQGQRLLEMSGRVCEAQEEPAEAVGGGRTRGYDGSSCWSWRRVQSSRTHYPLRCNAQVQETG
jgi:hypothetical protein